MNGVLNILLGPRNNNMNNSKGANHNRALCIPGRSHRENNISTGLEGCWGFQLKAKKIIKDNSQSKDKETEQSSMREIAHQLWGSSTQGDHSYGSEGERHWMAWSEYAPCILRVQQGSKNTWTDYYIIRFMLRLCQLFERCIGIRWQIGGKEIN